MTHQPPRRSPRPSLTATPRASTPPGKYAARSLVRPGGPNVLLLRRRFAVVLGAENLFARRGVNDARALGQIHVRSTTLEAPAGHRELHALLHGERRPAKLSRELLWSAQFGLPPDGLAVRLGDVEHDVDVGIDHLERDHRAGHVDH